MMAAIKGGCLPLAIDTGRMQAPKIPLSCHPCIHCNSGNVEDISHFVLYCKKHNNICLSLFRKHFSANSYLFFLT